MYLVIRAILLCINLKMLWAREGGCRLDVRRLVQEQGTFEYQSLLFIREKRDLNPTLLAYNLAVGVYLLSVRTTLELFKHPLIL